MSNLVDAADPAPGKDESASVNLYPPISAEAKPAAAKRMPAKKPATVVTTTLSLDEVAKGPVKKPRKARAASVKACETPSAEVEKKAEPEAKAAVHSSAFGWVELNGTRYDYDVIVHGDGTVTQRDKSISRKKKEKYGHTPLTGAELEILLAEKPEMIIIGTGQEGAMPLTPKAEKMLDEYQFFVGNTRRALVELASSNRKTVALLHVTC
jgi:hypothetical protein